MIIALVGDSIFDNGVYVSGGPDVADQLRTELGPEHSVSLLAIDGDITLGVPKQLEHLPDGCDRIFLSVGGNDALGAEGSLNRPASSIGEAALFLRGIQLEFEKNYRAAVDAAVDTGCPITLCTIYFPRFEEPTQQEAALAALSLFNDVILRVAFERGLSVIDLRLLCCEAADYANPIEPSVHGGSKIVRAMREMLFEADWATAHSCVHSGGND